MGIVLKQSIKNTVVTYLGFALGAINILFLSTRVLPDAYFGLATFIVAAGALFMPLMAFGVHNTIVKFYGGQAAVEQGGFLTLMLLLPLLTILPMALGVWLFYPYISQFIAQHNDISGAYVWHIFLVGLAMAYFEVFYAWSRVQLKSVFGNFMKEVFARLGVMLLLFLYYLDFIALVGFINGVVLVYLLRTFIMLWYAFSVLRPKLALKFPANTRTILRYSALIIIGGSAAVWILEIDKFMLNQYMEIANVAYYGVAIYIATVIIVPSRAMHQITYPLTAKLLLQNNLPELKKLYQKSSLTLFIASGILFLLIVLNLEVLYQLLPEAYRNGFVIVFFIGLAKVTDSLLGNINAILYNSKYYKLILLLGALLALSTVLLNMWLIPIMGINGAALASFMAIILFNGIKLWVVRLKFGFYPFGKSTLKVLLILLVIGGFFWLFHLPVHPIVSIILKSVFMLSVYVFVLYRLKISEDLNGLLSKYLKA